MSDDGLLCRLDTVLVAHGLMTRGAVLENARLPDGAISVAGPRAPISPLAGEMSAKLTEGGAASPRLPTPAFAALLRPPSARPGISPARGEIASGDAVAKADLPTSVRKSSRTIVLVGYAGSSIWPHFEAWRRAAPDGGAPDPLDRWSRHVIEAVAAQFGARAAFPSDHPYLLFQRWAAEAEGLKASPLGILIHPKYGLWHAYRGALLFDRKLDFPPPVKQSHPCDDCPAKPCLSACPVGAFDGESYGVVACRSHLNSGRGSACLTGGCQARHACPVGRTYAYGEAQQRFHMAAFAAAG